MDKYDIQASHEQIFILFHSSCLLTKNLIKLMPQPPNLQRLEFQVNINLLSEEAELLVTDNWNVNIRVQQCKTV